jgi:hypothetical protein
MVDESTLGPLADGARTACCAIAGVVALGW